MNIEKDLISSCHQQGATPKCKGQGRVVENFEKNFKEIPRSCFVVIAGFFPPLRGTTSKKNHLK